MFPVLYSPSEPEHFLGFFNSWIRTPGGISLCGSGSETLMETDRYEAVPGPNSASL